MRGGEVPRGRASHTAGTVAPAGPAAPGGNAVSSTFEVVVSDFDSEYDAMRKMPPWLREFLLVEMEIDVSAVTVYNAWYESQQEWFGSMDWNEVKEHLTLMSREAHVKAFGASIPTKGKTRDRKSRSIRERQSRSNRFVRRGAG